VKRQRLIIYFSILLVSLTIALVSSAEDNTLTDDSIVKLVKAGMSEEIVVNMVKTQPTKFDVSVDGLLALKTNDVSDKIINEMVLAGQRASVAPVTSPPEPTPTTDTTNVADNVSDPEIEQLCASLASDKPNEVDHALKVLRTMNAPQAVPKILPCLTNSNSNVIRDACRTLAVLGSKDTIPSIEPLLTNSRADVRKDAQDAIDTLNAPQSKTNKHLTPANPEAVKIYWAEKPAMPFQELGRVSVDKFHGPFAITTSRDAINKKLCEQAAAMGGNAIINVTEDFASVSGVAIKMSTDKTK